MSNNKFPLFPEQKKEPTVEEIIAEHEKRIKDIENFVKLLKGAINGVP